MSDSGKPVADAVKKALQVPGDKSSPAGEVLGAEAPTKSLVKPTAVTVNQMTGPSGVSIGTIKSALAARPSVKRSGERVKPKNKAPMRSATPVQPKPVLVEPAVAKFAAAEPTPAVQTKPVAIALDANSAAKAPTQSTANVDQPALRVLPAKDASLISTKPTLEDLVMTTTENNTSGIQATLAVVQDKTKQALAKTSTVLGEVREFSQGNVQALVDSGKILANGFQSLSSDAILNARTGFETVSGDIKSLAAVKSPSDFLQIQSDMVRKNFEQAVAFGSKNSEAMLKLLTEAMAPISGRVNLAVDKVRSTSI